VQRPEPVERIALNGVADAKVVRLREQVQSHATATRVIAATDATVIDFCEYTSFLVPEPARGSFEETTGTRTPVSRGA
jgi:hypothetical protein